MVEYRQYQARTLEVALSKAARDLRVPLDSVRYELVFDGRKGLFGFGQKDVVIRVSVEEMERVRSAPPPASDAPKGVGPVGGSFPEEHRQAVKAPTEGSEGGRPWSDRPERPPRRDGGRGFRSEGRGRDGGGFRPERGGQGGGFRPERGRRPAADGERGRGRAREPERGRDPQVRTTADHGSAGPHWDPASAPPLPTQPPQTAQGRALLETGSKLIGLMGLELECAVSEGALQNERPEEVVLQMRGPDDRLIIGRHGDVLDAFQYLVSRMFVRDTAFEGVRIAVDCSGYRHRHDQDLEERARHTADRVRRTGEAVQLEPMNPYQRRIVHMALKDEPGIKTFSTGEGFLRRLTIGPGDSA